MKYSIQIENLDEFAKALEFGASEIICGHASLSREGGPKESVLLELAGACGHAGLDFAVDVDRLIEQRMFDDAFAAIKELSGQPRIKDLGLAQACADAGLPFQLNLDTGNANKISVLAWVETWGPLCKKVILNHDIPRHNLFPILKSLKCASELPGLGSILMYYSPRKLLTWQGQEEPDLLAHSAEMGSGLFRLVERVAGTLFYFNKDLCLLGHVDELGEHGLTHLRLDFRGLSPQAFAALLEFKKLGGGLDALRECWPKPLLHGFFAANRSDSTFHHLPKRRKLEELDCIGEVLDQDEKYCLIRGLGELHSGDDITFENSGEMAGIQQCRILDLSGGAKEKLNSGELALLVKKGKIQTGRLLYSSHK